MTSPTLNIYNTKENDEAVNHVHAFYATLQSAFTMPLAAGSSDAQIENSGQFVANMYVYIPGLGFLLVTGTPSETSITLYNPDHEDNADAGENVGSDTPVIPVGLPYFAGVGVVVKSGTTAEQTTDSSDDQELCSVTLPAGFTAAPSITLTIMSDSDLGDISALKLYTRDITAGGFKVYASSNLNDSFYVNWVAVGS